MTDRPLSAEEQLAEQFASLLNRYIALKGGDAESVLQEIEAMLKSWGYQCIEGVWQKSH